MLFSHYSWVSIDVLWCNGCHSNYHLPKRIVENINPHKLPTTLVGTALWEPWFMKTCSKRVLSSCFFFMGRIEKSAMVLQLPGLLFLPLESSRRWAGVWRWPQWTGGSRGNKWQQTLGRGGVCCFMNILHPDCHLPMPLLWELGACSFLLVALLLVLTSASFQSEVELTTDWSSIVVTKLRIVSEGHLLNRGLLAHKASYHGKKFTNHRKSVAKGRNSWNFFIFLY